MQVARMKAEARTALGRNKLKSLREQGWMPAVVYGEKKAADSISISEWELEQHIRHHHKIFQLEYAGQQQHAMIQAVQFCALTDRPRHCDFLRVDLTKPIEVEVEVTLVGHPVGASKGGMLMKDHAHVTVRCVPTSIPEEIEVAIDGLELEQSLLASQLVMPAGVELASPPDLVICHVARQQAQEAAAEAAPAAEGAAPAADAAKKADDKKPAEKKADDKKK